MPPTPCRSAVPGLRHRPQSGVRGSRITAIWRALAGVVTIALVLSGCGLSREGSTDKNQPDSSISHASRGVVENEDTPELGGKIVYGLSVETNGWNPATNQWGASGQIVAHALFDTLSAFDDRSQIHPYFATGFEHNADYSQWLIRLRPGVLFHNGKPANATAISRTLNDLKKSPITGQAFFAVNSITVQDEQTIVVKTNGPWVSFPGMLATQVGVVADPDWVESNDGVKPVGTGPFKIQDWKIGTSLTAQRNRSYWQKDAHGASLPYLDSVEFRVIDDGTARAEALKSGDIDLMQSTSGEDILQFQKTDGFQVITDNQGETQERFIELNTMQPPFDDVDARQAVAYATDKAKFNQAMSGGYNEVANGPFPPTSPWFVESGYPQYDPAKAKTLVTAVKARHGGKFEFAVIAVPDPQVQAEISLLKEMWEEAGIKVTIETLDAKALVIRVIFGHFQSTIWLQFDAPQPIIEGVWWAPENATPLDPPTISLNGARNKDPEIGAALMRGRAATDDATMKESMATIQKRLSQDVPYIWLDHEHGAIIGSDRLVNMTKYTLPDGAPGLNILRGAHPISQIWIRSAR
jgi:peptide/nickel transport system substrate-binding protein